MRYALRRVVGTGTCLGPIEATNDEVGAFFPEPPGPAWTPAWVADRLGIATRRSAFDFRSGRLVEDFYDGDMAYRAAAAAIEAAAIDASEIDRVIYATSTPEELMPASRRACQSVTPSVIQRISGCEWRPSERRRSFET